MKRVLLSHSYFYKFDAKQWRIAEPYPPLMTITAAALLREEGYEVALFDTCLADSEEGLESYLLNFNPDYFVIFDDGFNWLTKMCLTTMREAAFRMQKMAKAAGVKVITCSSDATDHYEKYLAHGADVVIRGEGEITLLELLRGYEAGSDLSSIPGIAFNNNASASVTAQRPVITDLDLLPDPAWDLIDLDSYREVWNSGNKPLYLNVATTRGCPYKCNWCAKPIYGNRYNARSPIEVVDEIEQHIENHQVDHFWMCDDIFGLKPGWVGAFKDEILKRGLKFRFKIQSRADLLLKEDSINALAEAGLDEVWIGAESGSQKILDAMEKGITVDQIHQATLLLKQKGIKVAFFIQYGYLNETWADIRKTLRMIKTLMPDALGISVSYPLPGTKFYEKVKADLQNKSNWIDSEDLDMMFKNTYGRKFYRVLHYYTHHVYAVEKGLRAAKVMLMNFRNMSFSNLRKVIKGALYLPASLFSRFHLFILTKWQTP